MKTNPVAILISDVHYNINTLKLADAAMQMAIDEANKLSVPLIVAGDLHDTKANLRGECVNAMLSTFSKLHADNDCYVLVGNHDKINEKSEEHSLNFLRDRATLINSYYYMADLNIHLLPYYHSISDLRRQLSLIPTKETIIMHQGLSGTNSGDYIQDKSAIIPKDVAGLRVISGHYHTRQTIELPNGGEWDYIGNPYTLNYAEASDPPKGFQVLYDDGHLEFVPTNLRKHIVIEHTISTNEFKRSSYLPHNDEDKVLVRVHGTKEQLAIFDKMEWMRREGIIFQVARFDLVPLDTQSSTNVRKSSTQSELLDSIIDSLVNTSTECKLRLKDTWKTLCE